MYSGRQVACLPWYRFEPSLWGKLRGNWKWNKKRFKLSSVDKVTHLKKKKIILHGSNWSSQPLCLQINQNNLWSWVNVCKIVRPCFLWLSGEALWFLWGVTTADWPLSWKCIPWMNRERSAFFQGIDLVSSSMLWRIHDHIKRQRERHPRQTLTSYPQHVCSRGAQPINPWPIESPRLPSGYPIGLVWGGQSVFRVTCFLHRSSHAWTVAIIS